MSADPIENRKLVDRFGRIHNNLRLSVTDRCNIRCFYCMPEENVRFKPRKEILSFEELLRFVSIVARLGVNKIRLTGGEPLVRKDLHQLVAGLRLIEGVEEISLTTNGLLLAEQASRLAAAGVDRLNISLDTLDEATFFRISRRTGLQQVLKGIEAAQQEPFKKIRLNAIAISNLTENEILPLADFARRQDLELRFIEFMPLDAENQWDLSKVLTGKEIQRLIESEFGELTPVLRTDPSQPATDFAYRDVPARIGFINPVSQPFCQSCNRLRLTAEGQIRNCLFSSSEFDARALLRDGSTDEQLAALICECIRLKNAAHGIDSEEFVRPERAMYQIGG